MKSLGRSAVGAGVVALVATCGPREASAAGFASARFGGEHGSVVETNPTALYYNPGAIAFSTGIDLMLDGQIAMRHTTWSHTAPQPDPTRGEDPNSQVGNSGHASAFNVFGGPAMGATMKLGNFAFGAGLFVPFGGRVSWAKNSQLDAQTVKTFPQTVDGVQRWDIIDGALTFIQATVGAAYKLGPLSIGVSGNFIASSITENRAKNPYGTGLPDTTSEGRAKLDVSGNNGSFGVGAMFEAVPDRLWLGASYQAQPGLGPQTLHGSLDIKFPPPSPDTLHQQVTFTQALPDIVRAGARWRVNETLELRVFGDYTRWSVMKAQCIANRKAVDQSIADRDCKVFPNGADASGGFVLANFPRNWNDTYGARLGGSYWVKPEIEVFAGLGYETAATTDAFIDQATMDANNVGVALGGRFFLLDSFYLAASYTHLQFFDRDNTGKSQLESINGVGVSNPTAQQDAGGKYTQWIGIFDVNVEKRF